MKATAKAPSNIALVKYWGKRDKRLMLPHNGSISMNLDGLSTTTTVEFDNGYKEDAVYFDEQPLFGEKRERVVRQLDIVRQHARIQHFAKVYSTANFPMGAGLASSASGFAALTVAATKAAGLEMTEPELSALARRGSGSACRSIPDGFVEWVKGNNVDGSDSIAHSIRAPEEDFGFRILVTISSESEKKVSSRAGMAQTVATSPFYQSWLNTIDDDLDQVREGIVAGNFEQIAATAEANALKMHATAITTQPPIVYWTAATMTIMHAVWNWREEGLPVYITIDGGPQVKLLCREDVVETLTGLLASLPEVKKTIVCKPSIGARTVAESLF